MRTRSTATLALVLTAALGLLAGCGGDDKPGYCSDRNDLKQSVEDLGNVRLTESGGIDRLKSQLQKVKTDANELVDSAKSDFPDETNALEGSVTTLEQSVQALPESPSAEQAVQVGAAVKGVVDAATGFVDATNSKCS